jgi:hypothetical protein
VLGKTHGLSLVGVARRLETTTTFKLYDGKGNVDVTDLIYAIGMKTYNQSPGNFTKKLIPFLAGRPTPQEISSWYKQFTGGLFSGVKAATELSQFWSKWRAANDGPLRKLMEREMISQCLANPSEASQSRGAYVVAKQIFEDTGRFGMLTDGIKDGTDFIEAKLFDPKTGAIVIHPVTGRIRHGLLVMKKTAYAWDGAGNAYSATTGVWSAFLVAKINIKNL